MISKHFSIKEFVPPAIWNRFGDSSIWFIDHRIVMLADFIRARFNKPMTINNWFNAGSFTLRGFRPPDTTIGGVLSQHRFGRAIDFNIDGVTPQEVYRDIMSNEEIYRRAGLTTVEDIDFTGGWNHCDIRATQTDKIFVVKP